MANPNKKRLLINLALLLVVAGLIFFVSSRQPDKGELHKTLYDKSIGDDAKELVIHSEGREDVVIRLEDEVWYVTQPNRFKADKERVRHLFTLLSESAEVNYDIKGKDLSSYGLDKDRLSISFNGVKMIFGNFNTVSEKRYILKGDKMYLISETISGILEMGEEALRPQEKPVLKPKPKNELKPEDAKE